MRFLCDVHIFYKIKKFLQSNNYYCSHINEILAQDRTIDKDIAAYCNEKDLILITKDEDFLDSYIINHLPSKLIKINLGNISTNMLIDILNKALPIIKQIENRQYF